MIRMPPVNVEPLFLAGGLDLITPTLNLKGGVCRDALNYECNDTGGYNRIGGYERFSGKACPSDAVYRLVFVSSFTNTPSVGDTITNGGGTATGAVIAVSTTDNYIAYTQASGTFTVGDTIKVGLTTIGTMTSPTTSIGSSLDAQYKALAANVYRALISAPSGSGAIRGVFMLEDVEYCLRDNAGATAKVLYAATTGGWSAVTLYNEISFTAGAVTTPADGATLTQGGVTATVKRVVTQSGAWGGTAAGRFIITNPAGGNFAAGAATLSGGATATLSGIQTVITLPPGGHCDVVVAGFTGAASSRRAYVADGVGRGFEFDGTVLVPIVTGSSPDTPSHVAEHLSYLMWGIDAATVTSEVGEPYRYANGDTFAHGDTVNGYLVQPGAQSTGTLAIFCNEKTFMLYGKDPASWSMVPFNTGTGARAWSMQNMAQSYAMDTLGVYALATALEYGNFTQSTLTNKMRPFMRARNTMVSASSLDRVKGQYRIFFSDGYGIYATIVNAQLVGCMPVFFPTAVNCAWEGTDSTGQPRKLFGGADGMVYEMDKGTSFDGAAIGAYMVFNWVSANNPRVRKQFRAASAEISGNTFVEIAIGYQFGYGSTDFAQPAARVYDAPFSSVYWDEFTWGQFSWDARTLIPTELEVKGVAENVQITLSSSSDNNDVYTVNSLFLHYTPLRSVRSNVA